MSNTHKKKLQIMAEHIMSINRLANTNIAICTRRNEFKQK